MTAVICVLRRGGDFRPEHVARLARQVRAHAPRWTPFVCFTDTPSAVGDFGHPLEHDWRGWFSKIEVLRFPGPALYLDLDVSVCGDLAPLLDAAAEHDFLMIESLWGPDDPNRWNSSVMGWKASAPAPLYELFSSNHDHWMKVCKRRDAWGDQGFIRLNHRGEIKAWQSLLPGQVMSFKRGALLGADTSDCRVLVSHAEPRPWAPGGADQWLAKRRRLAE